MSFSYISKYDSPLLRGIDDPLTPKPWNIINEIINQASSNKKLLDIGCGTAFKLTSLLPHFKEIIGIDISHDMVNAAIETAKSNSSKNLKILQSDSAKLPFDDNTFDIVTCMMSRWNISEIVRVLKPNGSVIIEHVGCEDKKDFKIFFGQDNHGWRGQLLEHERDEYLLNFYSLFSRYFDFITIKNGFWKTYYTKDGILELLQYTPTIKNFDLQTDFQILKKAIKALETSQGIPLIQNRALIHATNRTKNF